MGYPAASHCLQVGQAAAASQLGCLGDPILCCGWEHHSLLHSAACPGGFSLSGFTTGLGCIVARAAGEAQVRLLGWEECRSLSCSFLCLRGSVIFSCSPNVTSLARLWLSFLHHSSPPSSVLTCFLCVICRLGEVEPGTGDHLVTASPCCSPHRGV